MIHTYLWVQMCIHTLLHIHTLTWLIYCTHSHIHKFLYIHVHAHTHTHGSYILGKYGFYISELTIKHPNTIILYTKLHESVGVYTRHHSNTHGPLTNVEVWRLSEMCQPITTEHFLEAITNTTRRVDQQPPELSPSPRNLVDEVKGTS